MHPSTTAASLLFSTLLLTSCERAPVGDLAAPRARAAAEQAGDAGDGVEQSVTGHYEYFGFATGNYFKYSLTAIRHADGSVSGEVEERVTLDTPSGELVRREHGEVTCLTVTGNRARLAYRITEYEGPPSPNPDLTHGIIAVVDNGEGARAVPDSAANNPGGVTAARAQLFCDVGFARPFREVEHGNIQVRP
jgi:hypothetical protein